MSTCTKCPPPQRQTRRAPLPWLPYTPQVGDIVQHKQRTNGGDSHKGQGKYAQNRITFVHPDGSFHLDGRPERWSKWTAEAFVLICRESTSEKA